MMSNDELISFINLFNKWKNEADEEARIRGDNPYTSTKWILAMELHDLILALLKGEK
jgi:hypothetical protein